MTSFFGGIGALVVLAYVIPGHHTLGISQAADFKRRFRTKMEKSVHCP